MFDQLKEPQVIDRTIAALRSNGITASCVETGEEARIFVLRLIPEGAEIMTMTSATLETIGLAQTLNDPEKYDSIRNRFKSLDRETQGAEMRKMGSAPEWAVGSVHAVTEDGEILIASNTGSQMAAYAYGAGHVIWIVGAQKIVANRAEAMRRVYEYSLPLEDERAKKAYGIGSNASKVLLISKEVNPNRLTLVFVNEKLGF